MDREQGSELMEVLTAAALYLLMAARLPALIRRGHDNVFFAALLTGTAAALTVPEAYTVLDSVLGGSNWARLTQQVLMVAGVWVIRSGVIDAMTRTQSGGLLLSRPLPMVAAQLIQAALFLTLRPGATTTEFEETYAAAPAGAAFYLVVVLYTGWVCAEIAAASCRFLPKMWGAFCVGFALIIAGGALGACAAILFTVEAATHAVPALRPHAFYLGEVRALAEMIPTALIGVGLTIPAVAGQVDRLLIRRWEKAAIARLTPLRDGIMSTEALQPDPTTSRTVQLHRMLIGIWDADLTSNSRKLTRRERFYLFKVEAALSRHGSPMNGSRPAERRGKN